MRRLVIASIAACLLAPASLQAASTINCLDAKVRENPETREICTQVIDTLKAARGEMSKINCIGGIEDGYAVGRCESVDMTEQLVARDKVIAKLSDELGSLRHDFVRWPVYFAGKDETCLDAAHKPKNDQVINARVISLAEIKQRFSPTDGEAHCVVTTQQKKIGERVFTVSPQRCQKLVAHVGQETMLAVVADHICDVK